MQFFGAPLIPIVATTDISEVQDKMCDVSSPVKNGSTTPLSEASTAPHTPFAESTLVNFGTLEDNCRRLDTYFNADHTNEQSNMWMDHARTIRAMRIAHTACEAEQRIQAEEICCIDSMGVVHGCLPDATTFDMGRRMKLLWLKKMSRRCSSSFDNVTLMVDDEGRTLMYVQLDESRPNIKLRRKLICPNLVPVFSDELAAMDSDGIVHWTSAAECSEVRDLVDEKDGPALTPTGIAVDLDGSRAVFFSQAKSDSHSKKEQAEAFRAMRTAHAACEAEMRILAGEVCCIDGAGVMHGGAPTGKICRVATRSKLFRQKQMARRSQSPFEDMVCTIDPDGRAVLLLQTTRDNAHRRAVSMAAAHVCIRISEDVAAVDGNGIVHWNCAVEECGEMQDVSDYEDGPALTSTGIAVDLGGSHAVFFSRAKHGGYAQKEQAEALRAMRIAHAACDAEFRIQSEEVCCLGEDGVVYGCLTTDKLCDKASRLKLLRQKKKSRRSCSHTEGLLLTVAPNGRVVFFLSVPHKATRRSAPLSHATVRYSDDIAVVDHSGIVHWMCDSEEL